MGFVVMLDEPGDECVRVREGVLFCVWPVVLPHLFSVVSRVKRTVDMQKRHDKRAVIACIFNHRLLMHVWFYVWS
jgi:hypothetical protein